MFPDDRITHTTSHALSQFSPSGADDRAGSARLVHAPALLRRSWHRLELPPPPPARRPMRAWRSAGGVLAARGGSGFLPGRIRAPAPQHVPECLSVVVGSCRALTNVGCRSSASEHYQHQIQLSRSLCSGCCQWITCSRAMPTPRRRAIVSLQKKILSAPMASECNPWSI